MLCTSPCLFPTLNSLLRQIFSVPELPLSRKRIQLILNTVISEKVEQEWTDGPLSKLKSLKPNVEIWHIAPRTNRREEIIVRDFCYCSSEREKTLYEHTHSATLFRTYEANAWTFNDPSSLPHCDLCDKPLTVIHILDERCHYHPTVASPLERTHHQCTQCWSIPRKESD